MTKNRICTDLSTLVSSLEEKEEIRISEAARMLELSEHETEMLAKALAEYKILEIRYSIKGYRTLKRGPNAVKKESSPLYKKHPVSPETEKLHNAMRHINAEKRNRPTEVQTTNESVCAEDFERKKRLKEIREGLIAVRENLEKIRENLDIDLKNRKETHLSSAGTLIEERWNY